MTSRATGSIELDSYRLAQYTVSCPCYICGGGNNFDSERCRHCFAPLALAYQAHSQKIHPRMIAALGSSGAGKTVYLGMLTDMLSKSDSGLQLLARGAFSIGLQERAMAALSKCQFPAKTPNEPDRWNWVHCQALRPQHKPLELILPDLAGEALMEEIDHPNTYPVVRAFLSKCVGVIVLIDGARAQSGESEEDFQAMKLVSYLCELHADRNQGWKQRPTAIVFTKADSCDLAFEDPAGFARRHTPGLFQQCRERLAKAQFFAAAVAGSCGYRVESYGRIHAPLRIEPRGVVEPFAWLLEKLEG